MAFNARLSSMSDDDVLHAIAEHGSQTNAARAVNIPKSTFKQRACDLLRSRFASTRRAEPVLAIIGAVPPVTRTFILSSAQDGSAIHEQFVQNLEAYASFHRASIHIAGFTYNKALFEDHDKRHAEFHPKVRQYLASTQINISNKVLFCAEMNTLPTQSDPLSGFETYTRDKWGVFPHPRVTLKSVPVMWNADPKLIMTTGAVTLPNYVQKKAGIKAEFHHVIGAVIVEIDPEGDYFARHLIADKDGSFHDLDWSVSNGVVRSHPSSASIVYGDLHSERLCPFVAAGSWGVDGLTLEPIRQMTSSQILIDRMRPKAQVFHDILDFHRRNHHNIADPHHRFKMLINKTDSVEKEVMRCAQFIEATAREGSTTYIIDSNHDRAMMRWLKTADYKSDPVNALYFLRCQTAVYEALSEGDSDFLLAEWAMRNTHFDVSQAVFLKLTDSLVIKGIEHALHGDLGSNGAKGHVNAFSRMGPKASVAHTHSAAIHEGIYVAGHSCLRDLGYNRGGLTSWSPSHILTYDNGKRTILTMRGTKFCAAR
mgnify:CR=1 FL=1